MFRLRQIELLQSVSGLKSTVHVCLGARMSSAKSRYSDPKEGRLDYRKDNDFKVSTFGKFPGFVQANLALVPEFVAQQFMKFCGLNSAPLPLLFCSDKGQVNAPMLAKESDIR